MASYATRQDFYAFGLPAAACVPESRQIQSIDVSSSTLTLAGHGFDVASTIVRFEARGEGAALPVPLSAALIYGIIAVGVGGDLFRIAAGGPGGEPISLSTAGAGVLVVVEDFGPKLDKILEARSSYLDAHAIAYKPPFTAPVPPWATQIVCKLAALDFAKVLRTPNPQYKFEDLEKEAAKAEAFCARLLTGQPLATNPGDQTPSAAEAGARRFSRPPRGWEREDGSL